MSLIDTPMSIHPSEVRISLVRPFSPLFLRSSHGFDGQIGIQSGPANDRQATTGQGSRDRYAIPRGVLKGVKGDRSLLLMRPQLLCVPARTDVKCRQPGGSGLAANRIRARCSCMTVKKGG
jgi:hypothetical protein